MSLNFYVDNDNAVLSSNKMYKIFKKKKQLSFIRIFVIVFSLTNYNIYFKLFNLFLV